jgi:hypothetical protein
VACGAAVTAAVALVVQQGEWTQRNAETAREWERRDAERERERHERAELERVAEVQRRVAVIRALAIEAFTNAISLRIFVEQDPSVSLRFSALSLLRHRFDECRRRVRTPAIECSHRCG